MATVRAVAHLVERVLAPQGPLPALCDEQRWLARIVAEALDAPPAEAPFVTLTQAAAGTGKTIALLTPVLALAALQKRQGVRAHRATLSTHTNHLARQILDDDAPRVNQALEALGFRALSVATRTGRRQFIDTDRVERAIARLADRGRSPTGRALADLGAFSTFAEAEDHGVFVPAGVSPDALCVTARSRAAAAAAFTAAKRAADAADVVITNHALVLTGCRLLGRALDAGAVAETVLFDEADTLPEVARGVADDRIDLALVRDALAAAGEGASASFEVLARLCAEATRRATHRLVTSSPDGAAIVRRVAQVRECVERAGAAEGDAAEEGALLRARLAYFEACAAGEHAIAAIVAGDPPSLAVVHREPVRLLRRLLARSGSAFFVSATLAAPSATPTPNEFLRVLGIAPGMRSCARLNSAGWADLEPWRHGRMRFRFADRAVPGPFERDGADPVAHPTHLGYVARAIEEARRSGRVLVLCTSYGLAEALATRVADVVLHARGTRLAGCIDAFRASERAVLLTPAAWSGVSLPGLVDHVVIPRIPYRPHAVRDEARRGFLARLGLSADTAERLVARDRGSAARRKLAQGIGRGIRGPEERCTVWLLDPRFPLPQSLARSIGGPGQGQALGHLALINCIPARFRVGRRPAIDEGQIWPLGPVAGTGASIASAGVPGGGSGLR